MILTVKRLGQLHGKVAEGLQQGVRTAEQGDLRRRAALEGGFAPRRRRGSHVPSPIRAASGVKAHGNAAVEGRAGLFENRRRLGRCRRSETKGTFIFPQRAMRPGSLSGSGQKEIQSCPRQRTVSASPEVQTMGRKSSPAGIQSPREIRRTSGFFMPAVSFRRDWIEAPRGSVRRHRSGSPRRPRGRIRRGIAIDPADCRAAAVPAGRRREAPDAAPGG